jgi:Zn-dependent protease with chaperone function
MVRHRSNALAIALLLSAGIADAQTQFKSGFNLFSAEQDVQIGQESAAAAEQQLPLVNDSTVNAYVNDIGARLARNAGGPQFPYRFRVVNASDINAFALPGGFIYINRGILDQAKNEGEVAGVIAHEISHAALRHGTHQASKAYLAQAGLSILGGLLGGKVGEGTANIINAVGGFGLNALFMKYSRDLETQADVRGAQILAASGYSPNDMVTFFQTLEKVDTAKKTTFMSDHPAPPDRIARIRKEAQSLTVNQSPTQNVAQLQSIQARLRGAGSAQTMGQIAQGGTTNTQQTRRDRRRAVQQATTNVPAPATTMAAYTSRSGVYRIGYPSNWQVYDQGGIGVTIAPPGGIGTANGQQVVLYGAMVGHYDTVGTQQQGLRLRPMSSSTSTRVSLDDATSELLTAIQQSSPHLQLVNNSGQRITMGNANAIAVAMRGVDPVTNVRERVTLVTRQLADNHLIYVLFIVPEKDAATYNAVLNQMVASMQINERAGH